MLHVSSHCFEGLMHKDRPIGPAQAVPRLLLIGAYLRDVQKPWPANTHSAVPPKAESGGASRSCDIVILAPIDPGRVTVFAANRYIHTILYLLAPTIAH